MVKKYNCVAKNTTLLHGFCMPGYVSQTAGLPRPCYEIHHFTEYLGISIKKAQFHFNLRGILIVWTISLLLNLYCSIRQLYDTI